MAKYVRVLKGSMPGGWTDYEGQVFKVVDCELGGLVKVELGEEYEEEYEYFYPSDIEFVDVLLEE